MALFVIECRGQYAMQVEVVRAPTLEAAIRSAASEVGDGRIFDRFSAREITLEGDEGQVFTANYIE